MTTTQSKETRARLNLVARIGKGHLTPEESWKLATLVETVGFGAEYYGVVPPVDEPWRQAIREYRRLVPEGGETA